MHLNVGPDDIKEAMGLCDIMGVSEIAKKLSVSSDEIFEVMASQYDPYLDLISGLQEPSAIFKCDPVLQ